MTGWEISGSGQVPVTTTGTSATWTVFPTTFTWDGHTYDENGDELGGEGGVREPQRPRTPTSPTSAAAPLPEDDRARV